MKSIFSALCKNEKVINKTFLDIGCGIGWSLVEAQKWGFTACGVEPTKQVAQYARDTLKLNVATAYFSRELFQDDYFDFIMLNQVLEHVDSPREMLSDAVRILKPHGTLFVGVPPFDWFRLALSRLGISRSHRIDLLYDSDEQVNYFSPKSIRVLAHDSNAVYLGQFHWKRTRKWLLRTLGMSTGSFLITKT